METNNAQAAIETLAADPTLTGCTWDERGIPPHPRPIRRAAPPPRLRHLPAYPLAEAIRIRQSITVVSVKSCANIAIYREVLNP